MRCRTAVDMMGDDVSGSNLGMWVAAYMHDIHSLTPADWSTRLGEFLFPRQHQNWKSLTLCV